MENISKIVLIIHTLIALGIIALVLLQRGKGADAGAGFGAGASGTVFGARGSGSFFSRATAVLATAFFASSLTLAFLSSQRPEAPESVLESSSVMEQVSEEELPAVEEEAQDTEMPALEPAGDEVESVDTDMPSLEEDPAPAEGTE